MKNDELINTICDLPWYLMNINGRKTLALMLQRSQNATSLTFGGMAPMNMNSFVEVSFILMKLALASLYLIHRFTNPFTHTSWYSKVALKLKKVKVHCIPFSLKFLHYSPI